MGKEKLVGGAWGVPKRENRIFFIIEKRGYTQRDTKRDKYEVDYCGNLNNALLEKVMRNN